MHQLQFTSSPLTNRVYCNRVYPAVAILLQSLPPSTDPSKPPSRISAGPSGPRSPAKAEAAVTDDFLARERHSTTTMPSSARSPANAEAVVMDRKHPTKINLCPCTPSSCELVLRSDQRGAGNICLLTVPRPPPSQPPCTPSSMRLVLRSDQRGAGIICLLTVPRHPPPQMCTPSSMRIGAPLGPERCR